jgi:anti-sigma factor RsiW
MKQECVFDKTKQEELLLGYVDETLQPDSRRSYERHLSSCPQCEELLALHSMLDETLDGWKAPEVGQDFDAKLFARIRAEEPRLSFWQRWFGDTNWILRPAIPMGLAAAALVAVVAFRLVSPEVNPPAQVLANDLPRVERALEDLEALQAFSSDNNEVELPDFLPDNAETNKKTKSL